MASLNFTSIRKRAAYDAQSETVTVGALSIAKKVSLLSVTGTKAYTLANGLWIGQEKIVVCTVAATSPVGTLTLATGAGGNTIGAFGVVGESCILVWTGAAWSVPGLGALAGLTLTTV